MSGGVFTSKAQLRDAVAEWTANAASASVVYGNVSAWDTSRVTDMSYIFDSNSEFNDDINAWDVSSATVMNYMFTDALRFNQELHSSADGDRGGCCGRHRSRPCAGLRSGSQLCR